MRTWYVEVRIETAITQEGGERIRIEATAGETAWRGWKFVWHGMPATQGKVYSGTLLPVVGVFSMAGTLRLIPQSTQCNGALFLRTQIQYKTMKTEQCGFHQLQKENGVARLKMVVSYGICSNVSNVSNVTGFPIGNF